MEGPRCWCLSAGSGCRVLVAIWGVPDAGVQSGGVQGPGAGSWLLNARLWVQSAGCKALGCMCVGHCSCRRRCRYDGAEPGGWVPPCPEEEGQETAAAGRPPGLGPRLGESLASRAPRLCFSLNWCDFKLSVSRCEICHSCSKDQVLPCLWAQE